MNVGPAASLPGDAAPPDLAPEEVVNTTLHRVTVAAAIALAATAPHASAAQEFSADIVRTPAHGNESAKVYVGSSRMKLESYRNGQPESGAIWDANAQAMTLLLDTQHAYIGGSNTSLVSKMMAQSGAPPIWRLFHPTSSSDPCSSWNALMQTYAAHDTSFHTTFACQNQGNDLVGGRSAQRWLVTSTDRNGRKASGTAWIDSRLHIVSKTQDSTGTMQLANIQEGPQPASVFAIPASYHQLDMRQMLGRMKLAGGDSIAAAFGKAVKDVGDSAASNTASAAKTQATSSVTKKLKGILRLP